MATTTQNQNEKHFMQKPLLVIPEGWFPRDCVPFWLAEPGAGIVPCELPRGLQAQAMLATLRLRQYAARIVAAVCRPGHDPVTPTRLSAERRVAGSEVRIEKHRAKRGGDDEDNPRFFFHFVVTFRFQSSRKFSKLDAVRLECSFNLSLRSLQR